MANAKKNKAAADTDESETLAPIVLPSDLAAEGFALLTGSRWWLCDVEEEIRGVLLGSEESKGIDDKIQIAYQVELTQACRTKLRDGEVGEAHPGDVVLVGQKEAMMRMLDPLLPGTGIKNKGKLWEIIVRVDSKVPSKVRGHNDWFRFMIASRETKRDCMAGGARNGSTVARV